jgi:hypothetical protein
MSKEIPMRLDTDPNRKGVEHELPPHLIAQAGQALIRSVTEYDARPVVAGLRSNITNALGSKSLPYPEEVAMVVEKGCRNAALTPLIFEGSLQVLRWLKADPTYFAPWNDQQSQDAEINIWNVGGKLQPTDIAFLNTLNTMTNTAFASTIDKTRRNRPYLVDLWEDASEEYFTRRKVLVDKVKENPESEWTEHDKAILRHYEGGLKYISPIESAEATNITTTRSVFNILIAIQRRSGNVLTGRELALELLSNMNVASGLMSGRRDTVDPVIASKGDPYDEDFMKGVFNDTGLFNLGQFSLRAHARVSGDCPGHPLYSPGSHEQEDLGLIRGLRLLTNDGAFRPEYPSDKLRTGEANLFVGAVLAANIWGNAVPFRPRSAVYPQN